MGHSPKPARFQPGTFGSQREAATGEGTQLWTLYRRQVSPPIALRSRLDMAGAPNGDGSKAGEVQYLIVKTLDLPARHDEQNHHAASLPALAGGWKLHHSTSVTRRLRTPAA